ncbi:4-(cytidine 5'-diphospho)-2-C-methyl-D-erythritol kinase [Chloroflexota bacterium]
MGYVVEVLLLYGDMPTMTMYTAPAKINLTLEVLQKRRDGYHEIRSLMQTIDLYDTLLFDTAQDIHLICNETQLTPSCNLVLKSAELLQDYSGCASGAKITLHKHIPIAAGLGGGSSDAAATLKILSELWELSLPPSQIAALARELGSDIPFFLTGGLALAEGRGDKITPLQSVLDFWAVLLVPPIPRPKQKTAQLYASLNQDSFTQGQHTAVAIATISNRRSLISDCLYNTFESTALTFFEGLEEYWMLLEQLTETKVHLAGSGPSIFAMFQDRDIAYRVHDKLQKMGLEAYLVRPV